MSVSWKEIGETYVGDNPGILKVKHITIGVSTASPDVVVGDAAVVKLFTVPAGTLIVGSRTRVKEAFTSSVTLAIGDTDSAVWSPTATIAPQSTGVMLKYAGDGSIFSDTDMGGGKIYDAAQDINITVAAATCAAGLLDLFVTYAENGLL